MLALEWFRERSRRRACGLGIHAGHENGGMSMFTCSWCGKSLWQTPEGQRLVYARLSAELAQGRLHGEPVEPGTVDILRRDLDSLRG